MKMKQLLAFGLTAIISLSLPITSHAVLTVEVYPSEENISACPLKIFGQPVVSNEDNRFIRGIRPGRQAIVILAGADRIEDSDLQVETGIITKKELNNDHGRLPEFDMEKNVGAYAGIGGAVEGMDYIEIEDTSMDFIWSVSVFRIPDTMHSIDELREYSKYVIYANGYQSDTINLGWQKNEKGYWYNDGNGSYPVSEWREIDGKFYYFQWDGYMACSTWTDDGYYVDDSGAWVPGYDEELREGAVIDYTKYFFNEYGYPVEKEEYSVPVSKVSDINNLYNHFTENDYPKFTRSTAIMLNSKAHMQKLLDMMGDDHTMRPGL